MASLCFDNDWGVVVTVIVVIKYSSSVVKNFSLSRGAKPNKGKSKTARLAGVVIIRAKDYQL